jgi:hypothetical protein
VSWREREKESGDRRRKRSERRSDASRNGKNFSPLFVSPFFSQNSKLQKKKL